MSRGLGDVYKRQFGESGIVPAAFVAILLNVILPKSKPANEETSKDE